MENIEEICEFYKHNLQNTVLNLRPHKRQKRFLIHKFEEYEIVKHIRVAAGAVAFMNAKLVSGIDTLIECTELAKDIRDADWIITGEGSFDSQSLNGKVISGILKTAGKSKAKIVVLPGISNLSEQQYKSVGITDVISARKEGMSLNEAITHAEKFLAEAAREFAEKYLKN